MSTQQSPVQDTSPQQQHTLIIDRHFKATPLEVFTAWTDPEQLLKWWGPEGMTMGEHKLDIREGGSFETTMVSSTGDTHTVGGKYLELTSPSRLVMTWAWIRDGKRGHETRITMELSAADGGTHMHFEQTAFENQDGRDQHNQGWSSSFNCLDQLFG